MLLEKSEGVWKELFLEKKANILLQFPIEMSYPSSIIKNSSYLTIKDCFQFSSSEKLAKSFREMHTAGFSFEYSNVDYAWQELLKYWEEGKFCTIAQLQQDLCRREKIISPDMIFKEFDVPMLTYLFLQQSIETDCKSDEFFDENDTAKYCRRHKKDKFPFGIVITEAVDVRPITIQYPIFCSNARIALFEKFFVLRRNSKRINSLNYQCIALGNFSPEDAWYYEMCTGISLTLIISAFLLSLDTRDEVEKDNLRKVSSWQQHRKQVFLQILERYRIPIVTCPTTYWRINMLDKIFRVVNNAMHNNSETEYAIYTLPLCQSTNQEIDQVNWGELEWFLHADRVFQDSYKAECARLMHSTDRFASGSECSDEAVDFPHIFIKRIVEDFEEICRENKNWTKQEILACSQLSEYEYSFLPPLF